MRYNAANFSMTDAWLLGNQSCPRLGLNTLLRYYVRDLSITDTWRFSLVKPRLMLTEAVLSC